MKKLAIEGHIIRGNEVIKLLEMLGGKNIKNLCGSSPIYYYIESGEIHCNAFLSDDYKVYTLEEFEKKFPYKVGDKVWLHYENSNVMITEIITRMRWCNKWNYILYDVYTCDNLRESAFTPYKEETIAIDDFKANTKVMVN